MNLPDTRKLGLSTAWKLGYKQASLGMKLVKSHVDFYAIFSLEREWFIKGFQLGMQKFKEVGVPKNKPGRKPGVKSNYDRVKLY